MAFASAREDVIIDRRQFLGGAVAGLASLSLQRFALGQSQPTSNPAILTIHPSQEIRRIPETYIGLSYELAELSEPDFFSEQNRGLVALFRRLSSRGVLRLGGNTSEFCWFQADKATVAPKLHVPPGRLEENWMPHRLFAIKPEAIDALAGFLRATGWRVIYGVNFGNSTPERAAVEAAYVAARLGDKIEYFQIGNEPDFYRDAINGTRPAGWGFDEYVKEWLAFADAITAKIPGARFGGPDVGSSSDWITRFGEGVAPKLGGRLVALTGHYYAAGPPDNPAVTSQRLLAGDPNVARSMKAIMHVAQSRKLAYRMTEGNSCYRGGKPGMSDAFAAALWAGDYLLELASLGCAGVNLHGGDSLFLSAGLGDHNPGLKVAGKKQNASNGFYTPIATEQGQHPYARPVYYGMLLANQFADATLVSSEIQNSESVRAYAAVSGSECLVAAFNKNPVPASVNIRAERSFRKASIWRLEAPSLDATTGVKLGSASVEESGAWHPRRAELQIANAPVPVDLPAYSAALIFLE